jgi:hypothetical protein
MRSPDLAKDWSRRLELEAVVRIKPSQKKAQTFISTVVKVKKSWWYRHVLPTPSARYEKVLMDSVCYGECLLAQMLKNEV